MKAALFEEFRAPLQVKEVPDPACPADGVVIAVRACGVCRSDWHAWNGADPDVIAPHVPGHEFAGEIIEVGPDCKRFKKGERVTAPFVLGCGHCPDCLAGEATICDTQEVVGFTGWGAFAEAIAIPRADFNLTKLPESLDYAEAAALGCRVTTAFRALVDRARLQPGEWLAVHGCGGVGLSAILIAKAIGARILAVDIAADKLAFAKKLGATKTLNASGVKDVGAEVRALTGGGAAVSIDALGVTQTFENSLRSLCKMGRHVQIGMPLHEHATPKIPLLELVYSRQITIHGTRGLPPGRFPTLLAMIEAGRLDVSPMITRHIALEAAGRELAAMDDYTGLGVAVIDRFS